MRKNTKDNSPMAVSARARIRRIPVWEEIGRTWDVVVFAWKILGRLGGPRQTAYTLLVTIPRMIGRMLWQRRVIRQAISRPEE